jgi:hypothetical protein
MKRIEQDHCQSCGSTSLENLDTGQDPDFQGYTRCCNERVIHTAITPCSPEDCYHD